MAPIDGDAWEFLEAPPAPLAWDRQLAIVAVEDIRILDDGPVAARVTIERLHEPTEPRPILALFVRGEDRWLLDDQRSLEGSG
jgi:hypothetical protein